MKTLTRTFALISERIGVIGPHADHEAELLLAGVKPIGWLCIPARTNIHWREEERAITALNLAASRGFLGSLSLACNSGEPGLMIAHHYCQPGLEKDMKIVAHYNYNIWNGNRLPDDDLEKSFGEYLGYTKGDERRFEDASFLERAIGHYFPQINRFLKAERIKDLLDRAPPERRELVEQFLAARERFKRRQEENPPSFVSPSP